MPPAAPPSGLLIAAPRSGSGKTLVTLALLAALRAQGRAVAGAKSGPDFIDPGFLSAAAGAPALTLDAWAMDRDALRARAAQAAAPLLLIEGAMGLIDGAADGRGSAADLAAALGAPVLLVLDAGGAGASVALAAAGARALRPDLEIAGALLNRVASPRHARLAERGLAAAEIPCLGAAPRAPELTLPSRHLGLTPSAELPGLAAALASAVDWAATYFDLDRIAAAARPLAAPARAPRALPPLGQRIAVADDLAFAFAYPHLLADWRAAGAEIQTFAPLDDAPPPPDCDAVFLPGGYPELHAGRLAAAARFQAGMRAAAARGARIYGECGGFMALGAGLIDAEGVRHPMLDLLPLETSFAPPRRPTLGYRRLVPRPGAPFAGLIAGHEHHHAQILSEGAAARLFDAQDAEGTDLSPLGLQAGRVCGSFAHVIAPL